MLEFNYGEDAYNALNLPLPHGDHLHQPHEQRGRRSQVQRVCGYRGQ